MRQRTINSLMTLRVRCDGLAEKLDMRGEEDAAEFCQEMSDRIGDFLKQSPLYNPERIYVRFQHDKETEDS